MASKALDDHDRCRKRVCVLCFKKGNRPISESELNFIQSNIIERYDVTNLNFPCVLCDACHILISKTSSNEVNVKLPEVESYDPLRPKILRDSEKCDCRICNIAESNFNKKETWSPY